MLSLRVDMQRLCDSMAARLLGQTVRQGRANPISNRGAVKTESASTAEYPVKIKEGGDWRKGLMRPRRPVNVVRIGRLSARSRAVDTSGSWRRAMGRRQRRRRPSPPSSPLLFSPLSSKVPPRPKQHRPDQTDTWRRAADRRLVWSGAARPKAFATPAMVVRIGLKVA